jgi:hypothetical protein
MYGIRYEGTGNTLIITASANVVAAGGWASGRQAVGPVYKKRNIPWLADEDDMHLAGRYNRRAPLTIDGAMPVAANWYRLTWRMERQTRGSGARTERIGGGGGRGFATLVREDVLVDLNGSW